MDLIELIHKCKNNERQAQFDLYNMYKSVLFSISLKYCRTRKDAEDNLQESFMAIFENINKYEAKGSFEGWIKRITINKALSKYRKNNTRILELKVVQDEVIEVDEDLTTYSFEELLVFVQNLPDRYRLVFNLYALDGYKHREIATMLNISEGTSKSNYHRAKKLLQTALKDHQKNIKNHG